MDRSRLMHDAAFRVLSIHLSTLAGPIQFYSEGSRNASMTLMYELLGDEAEVRRITSVGLLEQGWKPSRSFMWLEILQPWNS